MINITVIAGNGLIRASLCPSGDATMVVVSSDKAPRIGATAL